MLSQNVPSFYEKCMADDFRKKQIHIVKTLR